MDTLSELLKLPDAERAARGLTYTPMEIAQQPASWVKTFELFRREQFDVASFLAHSGICTSAKSKPTVFLIGAGTSDYIGQTLTGLFRKLWFCDTLAVPSTDLLTHMDELVAPEARHLWISFSRSGESSESVAVLQRALHVHPEIRHIVVSCNPEGRMIRESARDPRVLGVCLDDAVNDRGLAMTSSFSNMVIAGQCLAHINDLKVYENVLGQLTTAGREFLPRAADSASALAEGEISKVCFLGSGPLRGVARECALKVLEMTAGRVWAMSESVMGLRHGPMAALDAGTLLVLLLSTNPTVRKYEVDLLDEVKKKKLVGSMVVVGPSDGVESLEADDYLTLSIPFHYSDDYRAPVDVIFGQLLGLFCSLHHDLRPDSPSPSGAISRVVQNLSIHS